MLESAIGRLRSLQMLGDMGAEGRYFHVISRVVDRRFVFEEEEKEEFRRLLRKVEAFCGVEVITWTILSNHFHIVVHLPEKEEEISEEVFWDRLGALYSKEALAEIRLTMEQIVKDNPGLTGAYALELYRKRFTDRMRDLSAFMQTLKQRFTTWFNKRHRREGTLWEARFKSLLIEGTWSSVMTVAAYVELNSVRAGLCRDPKDYRWCGYAEAVGGSASARKGISLLYDTIVGDDQREAETKRPEWRAVVALYRKLLFGEGEKARELKSGKMAPVIEGKEKLSLAEALRCRVRYFADGLVLGGEAFIDSFFNGKRDELSPKRKTAPRKLRGADFGDLYSYRDLTDPVSERS